MLRSQLFSSFACWAHSLRLLQHGASEASRAPGAVPNARTMGHPVQPERASEPLSNALLALLPLALVGPRPLRFANCSLL